MYFIKILLSKSAFYEFCSQERNLTTGSRSRFGAAAQYIVRCQRLNLRADVVPEFPGMKITSAQAKSHVQQLDNSSLSSEVDKSAGGGCVMM